jgi:hypothetical protein
MKLALFVATLSLSAAAASAAPLTCNTNVTNNPRLGNTSITIEATESGATATEVTRGGLAQFITAPVTFSVSVEHIGPEVTKYTNEEEGFELSVIFQPINGKIHGSLTSHQFSQLTNVPVICVEAFN